MPDFQLVPGSGRELKSEQEGLLHTLMDATGYRPVPQLDNRNTGPRISDKAVDRTRK